MRLDGSNDTVVGARQHASPSRASVGVAWDRRVGADGALNPLAPVKGWLLAGSIAYAPPALNSNPFLVFQGAGVRPSRPSRSASSDFTLIGNLRYDHGLPIGRRRRCRWSSASTPAATRTVRGYDTDTLKSEIIRTNVSPLPGDAGFRVVPEGGNIRLVNTVELQFPIAKTFLGLPLPWAGARLLGHGRGHQPLGPGAAERLQALDRHQPLAPAHPGRAAVDRVRLSARRRRWRRSAGRPPRGIRISRGASTSTGASRCRAYDVAPPHASLAPVRPRVLVVDDEPNMCRSLAILVADEGRREVDTARSGEEALPKIGDSTDVLLCDLSMPGIDGIEVLRRVRARELDVQVILMTAYSTVQSAVEAMRLGAHEYLIKPFTNEEVLRRRRLGAAADAAEPLRAQAARRRRRSPRRDGRQLRADAAAVPRRRARRRVGHHGAGHRRVGHRQGAGGARHPRARQAARSRLRRGQLRGAVSRAARVGAVRPRARRLHRRAQDQDRPARAGRRRHHLPRRDRRHVAGAADQALARARGAQLRARRRLGDDPRRPARGRRDQSGSAARHRRRALSRGSVLSAQRRRGDAAAAARAHRRPAALVRAVPRREGGRARRAEEAAVAGGVRGAPAHSFPGNVRELENLHRARHRVRRR